MYILPKTILEVRYLVYTNTMYSDKHGIVYIITRKKLSLIKMIN